MGANTISIRYIILGLLVQRPMYGYDIKRLLESLDWLVGSPSFGSLYPALRALLDEGLVTVNVVAQQDKPPRKIYHVTEAGTRVIQRWINQPADPDTSLKAFVMRLILADNFSPDGLSGYLEQRRAQVASYRADLERTTSAMDVNGSLGRRLALDYGLSVAKAELDWLNRVLKQIEQQPVKDSRPGGETQ